MKLEDYESVFLAFVEAKKNYQNAVLPARERLAEAQAEYADALVCPESLIYEEARDNLTKFRRWAFDNGFQLTDPRYSVTED